MTRSELTLAIAATLVVAVLAGWVLRWLYGRLNARGPADAAETADLAARLHEAEDARARAQRRLAAVEADLGGRLAQAEGERDAALARLDAAEAQADAIRGAYRDASGRGGVALR